jgi:hypothetical protein
VSLAEAQRRIRDAVVTGEGVAATALLTGGRSVERRLAVHARHYRASLTGALLQRFPATAWLLGSEFVTFAAQSFVVAHPPQTPCIAEYGADFSDWLATCPGAARLPYLRAFTELEWHVGRVSIEVARPPIAASDLAARSIVGGADLRFDLQPGLAYLESDWPIDELLTVYLCNDQPERFAFEPTVVRLEVRGARGEFHMRRLAPGTSRFRRALQRGATVGDAVVGALDADPAFDAQPALTDLFAEGLVTGAR